LVKKRWHDYFPLMYRTNLAKLRKNPYKSMSYKSSLYEHTARVAMHLFNLFLHLSQRHFDSLNGRSQNRHTLAVESRKSLLYPGGFLG